MSNIKQTRVEQPVLRRLNELPVPGRCHTVVSNNISIKPHGSFVPTFGLETRDAPATRTCTDHAV